MKIKDISVFDRPRERLLRSEVLSDAELLAVILQTGSGKDNAVDLTQRVIYRFGTSLADVGFNELMSVPGIGVAKACKIVAAYEFARRGFGGRISSRVISCASDVASYYMHRMRDLKQEQLVVVLLDSSGRVIKDSVVSVGTLNSSLVHPREVFKLAVKESANSIILVHNHPSGSVVPSEEDLLVSSKIAEAGRIFGIELLDHLIVGDGFWSWKSGL